MSAISFKAKLDKPDNTAELGSGLLVMLPKDASAKLPSRGMTMVEGTINGFRFRAVLTPDGDGTHWFKIDKTLRQAVGVDTGDAANFEIRPTKEWPEPKLTAAVKSALAADPQARAQWTDITPMARWDWLNWMDAVKLAETRKERPQKLVSMLKAGKRRPCCFNRAARTQPKVAELIQ